MRFLLDTHIFLWLLKDPQRVGSWLTTLEDPSTVLLLSAASSWELAIKSGIGRLELPDPVADYVRTRAQAIGAELVPIEHSHALAVADLPRIHRDPFDRLLVAQASALDATLLTSDAVVATYPGQIALVP